jgi:outer membrane receptor for ferrienterochelin and colicin
VVVSTSRRSRLDVTGFYDRRRTRAGHFITREQVEVRPAMFLSDVLRTVPSLRLTYLPGGQGAAVTGRGGCFPTYYLDGVRLLDSATLDGFVLPDHVEGIEVYTNATVPAQYAGGNCGAIVIWTRDPGRGDGSPLSWKRILAGGAAILGILLLSR